MIRKVLAFVVFAVVLSGCGRDMSTDGGRPAVSAPTVSKAQENLDSARWFYILAKGGNALYHAATPCGPTVQGLCYDKALGAEFDKILAAAKTGIDLAQRAVDLGDNATAFAKAELALDAALAALKIAQSYGAG